MEVISVPLASEWLERVWELYRKNSNTLGFLPRGALEEFTAAGNVLGALADGKLIGYAAWRYSKGDAVIVHLCVAEEHRGSDCAGTLLRSLIERCNDSSAIRLSCRKDYHAANILWPKHGFTFVDETVGRGADAEPLYRWRRPGASDAPLLKQMRGAANRRGAIVAIDANVFFDMYQVNSVHHSESSSLLARWVDSNEVCITPELRNEISRRGSAEERKSALDFSRKFDDIFCEADKLEDAVSALEQILPASIAVSDQSDRRQIAHAWHGGASIFASRDRVLLDHADEIFALTKVAVLRPADALARMQGDAVGNGYAPIRLQGTEVEHRSVEFESDLYPFQNYAKSESKAQWLAVVRAARATPNTDVFTIGVRGEPPRIALAIERSHVNSHRIIFLRSLSGDLTATLLRRVLSNAIESAVGSSERLIEVLSPGGEEVDRALRDLHFELTERRTYSRRMVRGLAKVGPDNHATNGPWPFAMPTAREGVEDLERDLWPIKIVGMDVPTFIVPIKEAWAAALFDSELANRGLFPVPIRPALALENVYYSASNVSIPPGSRIAWYVSGKIREVRAVSTCLATDADKATHLARRYHRLGVYQWRDVLAAAGNNPDKELRAYMFTRTEVLRRPVEWKDLRNILIEHTRKIHTIQSPLRITENVFSAIYEQSFKET